jgi:single-stranded DNA-binding protein
MDNDNSAVMVDGLVETHPEATAIRSEGIQVAWTVFARAFGTSGGQGGRWVRVVAGGALADHILKTVVAGDSMQVTGSLERRWWIDSNGSRRSVVELRAHRTRIAPSNRAPGGLSSQSAAPAGIPAALWGAEEETR